MHLSRYQLGQYVPLAVQCRDADRNPVAPDSAPTFAVYDGDFTSVATGSLPPKDKANLTGWFEHCLRLDSSFSEGIYHVRYEWTAGSHTGVHLDWFEVVGGGDAKGSFVGLCWYTKPHAAFVVGQLDDGTIDAKRNPRV